MPCTRTLSALGSAIILSTLTSTASAGAIFQSGFDAGADNTPGYEIGDLEGQFAWSVPDSGSRGRVQDKEVNVGSQALMIRDAANTGRARHSIGNLMANRVVTSMDMFVKEGWRNAMSANRYEAQGKLKLTGAEAGAVSLEFGVMSTPVAFQGLQAGESAYFVEISRGDEVLAFASQVIDFEGMAAAWQHYDLVIDAITNKAALYVNGNEQASVDLLGGATTIAKVQLQNQRWGSGNDDSIIYFDGLNMYSEVPAPGALALLGLAGLAARRRRRA